MPSGSLRKDRSARGAAVAMTPAQAERQDIQCEWLRLAIAAQELRASRVHIDPASLELPRHLQEHDPCAA